MLCEGHRAPGEALTLSPEPVLEARDVVKTFGRVQALRGANFTVYPQEVVALVGDNGAGKSTLVKTLVGVHPPDTGQILFELFNSFFDCRSFPELCHGESCDWIVYHAVQLELQAE